MRWERLDWGNKRYFVYESKSPKGRSPSTTLYNYDVLIDFPDRKFTIGRPGSLKFNGVKQVWSLLDASPGQERKLTIECAGKQFTVIARVQNFLGDASGMDGAIGRRRRTRRHHVISERTEELILSELV